MAEKLKDYLGGIDSELAKVINAILDQTDMVHNELPHRRGKAGTENIYGEEQKALDVWTNDVFVEKIQKTGVVKAIVSEELGEPWINPDKNGSYVVSIDPLDGSSNIESNNCFGTIVGVHKQKDMLVPARQLECAFYNLYGPITTAVIAHKGKVREFVKYRKGSTEYFLGKDDIKLPEPGKLIGLGGTPKKWTPPVKAFIDHMYGLKMKVRYGGAFVGDINQILYYGGCFMYPEMEDKPEGKLRLVIECGPMSYVVETAGGASTNGTQSILDLKPTHPDQRT
ncbi:MAG: fructose-1,6-bisphosphatase, partial [Candidatus Altiarchaeota archaeon]|nr:fructose-1,6-bisphosphatase [Candidatus Altiarchaeota archaeon]